MAGYYSASEEYADGHLRQAVGQIIENTGFSAISEDSMNLLSDVMRRFMQKICEHSKFYAEHAGRTKLTHDDLSLAFRRMRYSSVELYQYLESVAPINTVKAVPRFPMQRPGQKSIFHSKPSSKELETRPEHVPRHFPPMVGGWTKESGADYLAVMKPSTSGDKKGGAPDFPSFAGLTAKDLGLIKRERRPTPPLLGRSDDSSATGIRSSANLSAVKPPNRDYTPLLLNSNSHIKPKFRPSPVSRDRPTTSTAPRIATPPPLSVPSPTLPPLTKDDSVPTLKPIRKYMKNKPKLSKSLPAKPPVLSAEDDAMPTLMRVDVDVAASNDFTSQSSPLVTLAPEVVPNHVVADVPPRSSPALSTHSKHGESAKKRKEIREKLKEKEKMEKLKKKQEKADRKRKIEEAKQAKREQELNKKLEQQFKEAEEKLKRATVVPVVKEDSPPLSDHSANSALKMKITNPRSEHAISTFSPESVNMTPRSASIPSTPIAVQEEIVEDEDTVPFIAGEPTKDLGSTTFPLNMSMDSPVIRIKNKKKSKKSDKDRERSHSPHHKSKKKDKDKDREHRKKKKKDKKEHDERKEKHKSHHFDSKSSDPVGEGKITLKIRLGDQTPTNPEVASELSPNNHLESPVKLKFKNLMPDTVEEKVPKLKLGGMSSPKPVDKKALNITPEKKEEKPNHSSEEKKKRKEEKRRREAEKELQRKKEEERKQEEKRLEEEKRLKEEKERRREQEREEKRKEEEREEKKRKEEKKRREEEKEAERKKAKAAAKEAERQKQLDDALTPAVKAFIATDPKFSKKKSKKDAPQHNEDKAGTEGEDEIWICPACSVAWTDGATMVCCDKCDNWFHWHCVGLLVAPDEDTSWFCQKCASKRLKKPEKRLSSRGEEPFKKRKKF